MLKPFEWKDKPAPIEHLFPVRKISAESYKEQMAGAGKTLTALGSYWKGWKSLILNKACILGSLLPATEYGLKDLEIFELLMGMDKQSLEFRLKVKNDKSSRFFLAEEQDVRFNAPYNEWVRTACRAEECHTKLFDHIWSKVNKHLGTSAVLRWVFFPLLQLGKVPAKDPVMAPAGTPSLPRSAWERTTDALRPCFLGLFGLSREAPILDE